MNASRSKFEDFNPEIAEESDVFRRNIKLMSATLR
jgi:hypothetical protein